MAIKYWKENATDKKGNITTDGGNKAIKNEWQANKGIKQKRILKAEIKCQQLIVQPSYVLTLFGLGGKMPPESFC